MENNKDDIPKRRKIVKSPHSKNTRELRKVINEDDVIRVPLYKNSTILLDKSLGIDTTTKLQVERVLEIDTEHPDAIYGFNPALYKEFITKTNKINTIVKVGQEVTLREKHRHKTKANTPKKVKSLHFAALNDMTIIVAVLENNDYYPSYLLE